MAFAVGAAVLWADPALARLAVTHAEYAAGVLVVRGETSEPRQKVTIDGRYEETTTPDKRFRFRIRYLPADCAIRVKAGEEIRHVVVKNCQSTRQLPRGSGKSGSIKSGSMSSFSDRRESPEAR